MRFTLWILALTMFSCGSQQQSALEGLGYSGAGKNVAVLIGAPNNLPGVGTDIREMTNMFNDKSYSFFFTVSANASASKTVVMSTTAAAVKDADSVFWFFSGHGGNGILEAQGGSTFTFKEVVAAIKAVRTTPFKRLIVMLDSCDSGSFVDGSSPIITEVSKSVYDELDRDSSLYEQAFVMSASRKNELASDLGGTKGGAFTYAMRTTMAKLLKTKPMATFKDLADQTIPLAQSEGNQTPVYRAFPTVDVLNDYLFLYRM